MWQPSTLIVLNIIMTDTLRMPGVDQTSGMERWVSGEKGDHVVDSIIDSTGAAESRVCSPGEEVI